jgi:hypothetical protein
LQAKPKPKWGRWVHRWGRLRDDGDGRSINGYGQGRPGKGFAALQEIEMEPTACESEMIKHGRRPGVCSGWSLEPEPAGRTSKVVVVTGGARGRGRWCLPLLGLCPARPGGSGAPPWGPWPPLASREAERPGATAREVGCWVAGYASGGRSAWPAREAVGGKDLQGMPQRAEAKAPQPGEGAYRVGKRLLGACLRRHGCRVDALAGYALEGGMPHHLPGRWGRRKMRIGGTFTG